MIQRIRRPWFLSLALGGLAALTAGGTSIAPKKSTTDPKNVPLELQLVAKKAAYPLDLHGLTAEEFKKHLAEAEKTGRYPAPPAVNLALELRNTGYKDLEVHVQGDANTVVLHLEGPGVITVAPNLATTQEFRVPVKITIPAGKAYTFPAIKSLTYGFRGIAQQAYWTKAGTYTLTASFQTAVSPAPKGSKPEDDGYGRVKLTSAPVKIKVEGK